MPGSDRHGHEESGQESVPSLLIIIGGGPAGAGAEDEYGVDGEFGGYSDSGHIKKGGNIKLKRKELNTLSLAELKQLHRSNGIKMNNNRNKIGLINNYIKNNVNN